MARRAPGRPVEDLVPAGYDALRDLLERFVAVGFSKFVVRPLVAGGGLAGAELERLADAVGDLQTSTHHHDLVRDGREIRQGTIPAPAAQ